jgi:catechol 2,3-dioxygenase-like lactoylglutathione lyase family enzyme
MTFIASRRRMLPLALAGLVALGLASCAGARVASPQPPRRGAFFALSVADVATMSRWYQDKLALRVLSSGEAPNKIAKFAILEGNGVLIEMLQHTRAVDRKTLAPTATEAHQIHGIFKAGLVVDDLDATYAKLKQLGVDIAYGIMPAGDASMRSFIVRDPEANLIQFFGT